MRKAVFLFTPRRIAWIIAALIVCLAVWATFGGFGRAGGPIALADRAAVLQSSAPVIAAIRNFEADNARPPGILAELVPRYLSRVPSPPPTVGSGRDYLYAVEPDRWRIGVAVRNERDGVLTYSSDGDYPPGKHGMSVERIGDWAYYHGNPF